jgi:CBS-domain-containing membrane protein
MNPTPYDRYKQLQKLLEILDVEQDDLDTILDEMDHLWDMLTEEEQIQLNDEKRRKNGSNS